MRTQIAGSRWAKVVKRTALGLAVLVSIGYVADWMWVMSGSNRWELKIDRDGTQVYTLKSPGSTLMKVRGVTQSGEFTLSNHLAPFFDESIQNDCGKWVPGCTDYKILKPFDTRTGSNVTMWTVSTFPPFAPREFLLQGQVQQDPVTKVVTLENIAVPNKIAPNDCCVRLTHAHNVWRYTPLPNGDIKVEVVIDLDLGGFFPRLLVNLGNPDEVHKMLSVDNPALLRSEKYRNARLDFIDDGAVEAVAQQVDAPGVRTYQVTRIFR